MSTPLRRQTRPAAPPIGTVRPQRPLKGAPRRAAAVAAPARRKGVGSPHDALRAPPPRDDIAQRADATREKLLAATHDLLREHAGRPVSVNEICTRAGANVAMVKYCFGGKDALITALLDRIVGGFIRELDEIDRRDLRPSEKLRIHVAELVRNYVRYPYLNRLVIAQLQETGAEDTGSLSRNFAIPARDWYRRVLAEGCKSGEFRAVDPTLFFFTVIGVAEFFFTATPLLRRFNIGKIDADLLDRYIAHVTEMVLQGVRATAHPRKSSARRGRSGAPPMAIRR